MRALTPRQLEILAFVRNYSAEHSYPPSLREIAAMLGVTSTNGVNQHLAALRKKGAVTWEPKKGRSLRVVDPTRPETTSPTTVGPTPPPPIDPWQMAQVDVYERICGLPHPFQHHLLVERITVERRLFSFGASLFGFRLKTLAFTTRGFVPDDVVVFDRRPVRSGDLALVSFGGDVILRYVWESEEGVKLTVANPAAPSLFFRPSEWSAEMVVGVAVGMVRRVAPASAA